jgi:hypothetical protein
VRYFLATVIVATALTSGCSKSDEDVREEFRAKLHDQCMREIAISGPPRLDVRRFCDCFLDLTMKDRSTEELKQIDADPKAAEEAGKNIAPVCLNIASPIGG